MNKPKVDPKARETTGASQRTLGRIPKVTETKTDGVTPTHNRQWINQPDTGSTSSPSSSASCPPSKISAYASKPGGINPDPRECLDITSQRFVPDSEQKVQMVLRRMLGDENAGVVDTPGQVIHHDLPTIYSHEVTGIPISEAPGADLMMDEDDRYVSIAEFATLETNQPTAFHTITRRDAVTFMMVYRPVGAHGKGSWDFPSILLCQDFINDLLSKLYNDDVMGAASYLRSGRWGNIQTIVARSNCMTALSELRRQIVLATYKGFAFDTFPRDVVVAKPDVSILLRASMKTFQTDIIPKVLFNRNRECIAGSLRVLSTKFFLPGDKSHKGESKEHWRSVSLKGDEQFLRCLRFIPESKPFLLGYDAVQIRGGLRPQELPPPYLHSGTKRGWSDISPAPTPLLTDPRTTNNPARQYDDPSSSSDSGSARGNKRGRPYRGGGRPRGRGRFQRK